MIHMYRELSVKRGAHRYTNSLISLYISWVFPLITRASESAVSSVSMCQSSLCLVYFSLLYVFGPLWHAHSFTYYPPCPCVFVFSLFFSSLCSYHAASFFSLLIIIQVVLSFPCFHFPLFLSVLSFADMIHLYCICFLSSSFVTLRLPPTLPHCLMRDEDLGVRIVRSLNSSPGPSPGNAVSVFFFLFKIVFTSFHFLICFHHSVITVFCQPVINGPAERFRLSACGCVYAGVHVCIYARQCVREEMHGHSDPIIVIRFDLYKGKNTAELHLDFQIKRCYTSIRVCKKPMEE